jgi:ADP-heptose:LPS heptosyltransferase
LFVQRFSCYIDRFVEFEGYPGIDEVPVEVQQVERFLVEQRAYGYDVAIQMHGSGRTSNPFVLSLDSPVTVGYYEERDERLTYGAVYPEHLHEIERNLHLVALLAGGRATLESDTLLEFPLFAEDYAETEELLRPLKRKGTRLIAIHPGARPPARRWPSRYFATVADRLAQYFNAQIVLTGSADEERMVQEVQDAMHEPAFSLVGRTSLGGLAALMTKLDLFISNDTGPAHMACAVDCPSVTIFGPADVQRWAPLDAKRHPIVRHPVACSPCGYWECPIDHRCLRWLLPKVVISTIINMQQAGMQGVATP